MRNKTLISIAFLSFLLGVVLIGYSNNNVTSMSISEQKIVQEPYKYINTYFCEKDDCGSVISNLIKNSTKVDCAFYDIDIENIINGLSEKNYRLVTDNTADISLQHISDTDKALMHNKFCIYDNKIISTGSFNPKKTSLFKDNNNLVVIESKYLAENYENEFEELFSQLFGSGDKVKNPKIQYGNILIENYFCSEDQCQKHLLEQLTNANKSIYGLLFSFTDTDISKKLVEKKNLDVKIVVEKQRINMQYEQYKFLKENGIDIKTDSNKYLLHDKTWIIDNETIIIGSYNPTSAGNTKNDENMLIIHSPELAKAFLKRFDSIYSSAN